MTRHAHCCMDIRGALHNIKQLVGSVTNDEGRKLDRDEIFSWLCDELAKGRRVLPFGKPCEGFDYQTGCPGHDGPYPGSPEQRTERQP